MFSKSFQMKGQAKQVTLLIVCAALLSACPKQGGGTTESGAQENAPATNNTGGPTATFIKNLCSRAASKFTVTDEGAAVVYEELRFSDDGAFEAATTIRLGDEPFECTERGRWSLEGSGVESKSSAALLFEMTETNCAGREAPFRFRARATLSGDEVQLSHI
ncbi:MAG TPA: hypothetical protein DIU15_03810 [Deltaproteobacteria bacterium]|nr:hypothetical protein [Deltaproteobacteria bacterium]HCP45139.1 hypothetical protein [Deltaproteobacteria bacterium]